MEVKREDRMGGGTIRGGQGDRDEMWGEVESIIEEPRLKKIFMKLFK